MKKFYTVAFALSASLSTFAQIPTNSLVARYDFSSTANAYTDGSGNNLTLCEGSALATTDIRLSQNAAHLPGDSAAYFLPYGFESDVSHLNACSGTNEFQTPSVSIAAWIKIEEFHTYNVIAGVRYNNSASPYNSIALNTNSSHYLEMGFTTTAQNDVSLLSTIPLEDSVWYHVACTYDATTGTASLYLDGVLDVSYTALAGDLVYNTNKKLVIGQVDGGEVSCTGCGLGGFIDEVLYYGRALTATEIGNIYNNNEIAGINTLKNTLDFKIFPNPAKEILNIDIPSYNNDTEHTIITLVNILGETVGTQQLHAGNNSIDVSALNSGIYFIHSDKSGAMKFVKE